MNKRRRHRDRREVVVTPEEDEVAEIRKEIQTELHIKIQTKIGTCPPQANRKKEVGKSTKGKVHQTKVNKTSKVAFSNLLSPRPSRKTTTKKQIALEV